MKKIYTNEQKDEILKMLYKALMVAKGSSFNHLKAEELYRNNYRSERDSENVSRHT